MTKTLSLILGIAVGMAFLGLSIPNPAIKWQLIFALLAGLCVYVGAMRRLDFNDANTYLLMIVCVVLSFALECLLIDEVKSPNLAIYLGAYLLGSVPFGLLLGKIFAKVDIKALGSKSIGATNVLRVVKEHDPKLAKRLAVATFVLDFLKAAVPIFVLKMLGFDANMLWSVGVFAVLGHCFSAYLSLNGGKGVATGAGVMGVLLPLHLAIALVVWFVVGKVFKISSLASLGALLTFLIALFFLPSSISIAGNAEFTIPSTEAINTYAPVLLICTIIIYRHIPNIKRLLSRQECKVV